VVRDLNYFFIMGKLSDLVIITIIQTVFESLNNMEIKKDIKLAIFRFYSQHTKEKVFYSMVLNQISKLFLGSFHEVLSIKALKLIFPKF